MRRFLKWFGIVLGGLVTLTIAALAVFYVSIGKDLGRTWERDGVAIEVPTDNASVEEGARLARLRGCFDGCHGDGASGSVWMDFPDGSQMLAPNLGAVASAYSDEDLERLIRHGIRPDGSGVLAIMPSPMLYYLSDDDLGRIIAWLRSLPASGTVERSHFGPLGRSMLAYYRNAYGPIIAPEHVLHDAARPDPGSSDPIERGRYLALTTCTECHGEDLRGDQDFAPPLSLVLAYTPEQFRHLMRTGEPIGDRQLDLMARIAEGRTVHFTDEEIDDLFAYLRTLAVTSDET